MCYIGSNIAVSFVFCLNKISAQHRTNQTLYIRTPPGYLGQAAGLSLIRFCRHSRHKYWQGTKDSLQLYTHNHGISHCTAQTPTHLHRHEAHMIATDWRINMSEMIMIRPQMRHSAWGNSLGGESVVSRTGRMDCGVARTWNVGPMADVNTLRSCSREETDGSSLNTSQTNSLQ